MIHCTKCITPETHDSIIFDAEGVCSVCRQAESKHTAIDWTKRREMLNGIIEQYRGKGVYDCIVPFSGGKDSTFQLWYVVKELGLKPLVVQFNHWGFRPLVSENNNRTLTALGVDVLQFTPNLHVVKKLMREALEQTGDFCWMCHTGIYAHTLQVAIRYDIPLLIWGESPAEYTSYSTFADLRQVDVEHFNNMVNLGITADTMAERLGLDKRDLYAYEYPSQEELNKLNVDSISLGNYIKWDTLENVNTIKKELGWQGQAVEGIPPRYDYEKIECKFQGVRDYCRYIKRGYGRTNHLCSIDIRAGRMSREEGLWGASAYDGQRPYSLEYFLKFIDMTEAEFERAVKKHTVEPWQMGDDYIVGERLPDMGEW